VSDTNWIPRGPMSEMAILQQWGTLWSGLCVTLMPIIRRRRQPPDVLRFFQIDSAVSRLLWIDIDDIGHCPFACEKDMNPDFHAHAQCDGLNHCELNLSSMRGQIVSRALTFGL
jgi:hypothetical protein